MDGDGGAELLHDRGAGEGVPRAEVALGYVETPIFWRPDLAPGQEVRGPAVIEEFGSTVPLHPGFAARIAAHRNGIVTREDVTA